MSRNAESSTIHTETNIAGGSRLVPPGYLNPLPYRVRINSNTCTASSSACTIIVVLIVSVVVVTVIIAPP